VFHVEHEQMLLQKSSSCGIFHKALGTSVTQLLAAFRSMTKLCGPP
jgi:hypothetical protein